jgi:hypothetical protein
MSNIVPFKEGLPSTIVNRKRLIDVNKDVVFAAQFPTLSIKGKVFTLVQNNEKKVMTKPDDPDEVVQAINMAFLRINMNAKNYYSKRFSEDDSEGVRPDCYSMDGVKPADHSPNKQAEKCAICPHNQWGSRISDDGEGKGKACADHARVAIADPGNLDKPILLRVPPASLKPLKDALKQVKARQLQYNEVVFRVGFDREAASPKLTVKPVGVLGDEAYNQACEQFESEIVRSIVGLDDNGAASAAAAPAPAVEPDELDAALAARDATRKAAAKPAPAPAPKPTPKVSEDELDDVIEAPAPAPKASKTTKAMKQPVEDATPAPAPKAAATVSDSDDLLGDLNDILGSIDD